MLKTLAELARHALGLIYPPACLICHAPEGGAHPLRHGLCTQCQRDVTVDPFAACPWCAQNVGPYTDTANGCMECRGASFGFDRAIRLGPYSGALRAAVLRMKSLGGEGLADVLGRTFVESRSAALAETGIDVVAPIPLHWWRKWTRGYNQSESVARELAAGLNVAFEPHLLRRVKNTEKQTQSSRSARQENVKGAFRVARGARLAGRTVLLVDDVMTTCSTASEAARTLLAAGAERVVMAALARR